MTRRGWGPQTASDILKDVIVFDGDCVLCSRLAAFVHRHDPARTLAFTDIQSPTGQALADRFEVSTSDPETFILIQQGKAYFKSDATIVLFQRLKKHRWTLMFVVAPRTVRDWAYDVVAQNRYRWFGRKVSCALADPDIRSRIVTSMDELTIGPHDAPS